MCTDNSRLVEEEVTLVWLVKLIGVWWESKWGMIVDSKTHAVFAGWIWVSNRTRSDTEEDFNPKLKKKIEADDSIQEAAQLMQKVSQI